MTQRAKNLGQYPTPRIIADFMCDLISKDHSSSILDPCAGTGIFLDALWDHNFKNLTAYEVDQSISNASSFEIEYRDFLSVPIERKFAAIIGNPPYVRWKNVPDEWRRAFKEKGYWNKIMNGLGDLIYAFIYHAVNLLEEHGELIFICPLFWTETLHGKHLREYLSKNGAVELIVNLNEARVFREVSSTIVIFKYVKNAKLPFVNVVEYCSKHPVKSETMEKISSLINRLHQVSEDADFLIREDAFRAYKFEQFSGNEPWHPIPPNEKTVRKMNAIHDVFYLKGNIAEIGNGMVSGLDRAFSLGPGKLENLDEDERNSLIYVYKANSLERFSPCGQPTPYVFVNHIKREDEFKQRCPHFFDKLLSYKDELERRYSYNKDIPWWHWAFLRNKGLFERYDEKIFVPSKDRYDARGYFRFALVHDEDKRTYYATQDVTAICIRKAVREGIEYILGLLNSEPLQKWIMFKGFNRGGVHDFSEEPLKTIPIPRIDWDSPKETDLHRTIIALVKEIKAQQKLCRLQELDDCVLGLLELKASSLHPQLIDFPRQTG